MRDKPHAHFAACSRQNCTAAAVKDARAHSSLPLLLRPLPAALRQWKCAHHQNCRLPCRSATPSLSMAAALPLRSVHTALGAGTLKTLDASASRNDRARSVELLKPALTPGAKREAKCAISATPDAGTRILRLRSIFRHWSCVNDAECAQPFRAVMRAVPPEYGALGLHLASRQKGGSRQSTPM